MLLKISHMSAFLSFKVISLYAFFSVKLELQFWQQTHAVLCSCLKLWHPCLARLAEFMSLSSPSSLALEQPGGGLFFGVHIYLCCSSRSSLPPGSSEESLEFMASALQTTQDRLVRTEPFIMVHFRIFKTTGNLAILSS